MADLIFNEAKMCKVFRSLLPETAYKTYVLYGKEKKDFNSVHKSISLNIYIIYIHTNIIIQLFHIQGVLYLSKIAVTMRLCKLAKAYGGRPFHKIDQ